MYSSFIKLIIIDINMQLPIVSFLFLYISEYILSTYSYYSDHGKLLIHSNAHFMSNDHA